MESYEAVTSEVALGSLWRAVPMQLVDEEEAERLCRQAWSAVLMSGMTVRMHRHGEAAHE